MTTKNKQPTVGKSKKVKAEPKVKKPHGRPEIVVDATFLQRVKDLSIGNSLEVICMVLGISRQSLHNKLKQHPELQNAHEEGRAYQSSLVVGKLFEHVMNGSLPAAIFWIKAQLHWRETLHVDSTPAPPVNMTTVYEGTPQSQYAHLLPIEKVRADNNEMKEVN